MDADVGAVDRKINEVLDWHIDVLVELVGGLNPAGTWVRRALASGKSVVTANKELMAAEGLELSELACRHRQHPRTERQWRAGCRCSGIAGRGSGL